MMSVKFSDSRRILLNRLPGARRCLGWGYHVKREQGPESPRDE